MPVDPIPKFGKVLALYDAKIYPAGISALPSMLLGLAVGGPAGWLIERDGTTRRLCKMATQR